MKKVLITGATGLIGSRLVQLLKEKGYEAMGLVRNPKPHALMKMYRWNVSEGFIEKEAIEQADYIVHLAGENIAKSPWTKRRKRQLIESRVESTKLLAKYIQEVPNRVNAFIAASAIGYYGNSGDQWVDETAPQGKGFLSELCDAWEKSAQPIAAHTRLVQLRIGIVLSTKGGALVELAKSLQWGVGVYVGTGTQFYSWIHIDDLCGIIVHAIENEHVQGIYNAVAPVPVQNKNLVDAIRTARRKLSVGIPSPPFMLKWVLGEMSAAVLDSCRASSKKIEAAGYKFQFKTPLPALNDLYKRKV